jgi:hypothetical protein
MPTIPKIYIPAVFLGAPNFGSIDLVGLPGSLRLGRILRVGELPKKAKNSQNGKKAPKIPDFVKNCQNGKTIWP